MGDEALKHCKAGKADEIVMLNLDLWCRQFLSVMLPVLLSAAAILC